MAKSEPIIPLKITKDRSLKRLSTKIKQNRDKASCDLRPVNVIDTETWKGDIFLLADSDGDYVDTFKVGITIDTVISFLTRPKFETSWNFCYNLSYDGSVILKLLGKQILSSYKTKRAFRFKYDKYNFFFIPKKTLRISKGHHSWVFYDITQFYDFQPLQKAYKENIGNKFPDNYLKMKSKRKQFPPLFYKKNRRQVRQYCIDDCKLTKELSNHWIQIFGKAFGVFTQRWISSGYLAEKVLINHGVDIPFFKDLNYDLQEFAWKSYFGGRFEIIKRGFIGEAWLYDINSAYPFALSKIPDITKGSWRNGLRTIHKKALMGFFKIEVRYDDCEYIPAFAFRRITLNGEKIVYPSGNFISYATLEELKNVDQKNYKIIDSWQFFDDNPTYPFRDFIITHYDKRMKLKHENNPMQLPIKIILNAIYGKMGQKVNRRIGNLFNPVIFAYITGDARAQLFGFVKEHNLERDVVAFATDSVCVTRKVNVDSKELGGFSLEKYAKDVYFLQNGFYRFNGVWKLRGLGKLGSKEVEHIDTIEKDGRLYYKYIVNRTKQLASAIIQNKIEQIGRINEETREVNLNGDNARFWLGRLEDINDKKLNKSTSLSPQIFPNYFKRNTDYNVD
jgi:hypothetical protein